MRNQIGRTAVVGRFGPRAALAATFVDEIARTLVEPSGGDASTC